MKRIIFILFIFTIYFVNITAQDFPFYDYELVKTFNVGTGDGEIMTNPNSPYERIPTGLGFDKQGNLYICDGGNLRVIKYDNDFTFVKNYLKSNISLGRQLFITNENEFIVFDRGTICIYDSNANIKAFMSFRKTEYEKKISGYPNWIYYDNMLFTYLEDGSLISIPEPINNRKENLEKILNEEQTIKYLQEKYGTQDTKSRTVRTNNGTLTIDENGNIIVDGEIKTSNSNNFFKYKEKDRNNVKVNLTKNSNTVTKHIDGFTDEYLSTLGSRFLGEDIDNNTYWQGGLKYIFVYNKDSFLINAFKYDEVKSKIQYPAIHPSGDVYFIGYDDKQVYLYRIKRVW